MGQFALGLLLLGDVGHGRAESRDGALAVTHGEFRQAVNRGLTVRRLVQRGPGFKDDDLAACDHLAFKLGDFIRAAPWDEVIDGLADQIVNGRAVPFGKDRIGAEEVAIQPLERQHDGNVLGDRGQARLCFLENHLGGLLFGHVVEHADQITIVPLAVTGVDDAPIGQGNFAAEVAFADGADPFDHGPVAVRIAEVTALGKDVRRFPGAGADLHLIRVQAPDFRELTVEGDVMHVLVEHAEPARHAVQRHSQDRRLQFDLLLRRLAFGDVQGPGDPREAPFEIDLSPGHQGPPFGLAVQAETFDLEIVEAAFSVEDITRFLKFCRIDEGPVNVDLQNVIQAVGAQHRRQSWIAEQPFARILVDDGDGDGAFIENLSEPCFAFSQACFRLAAFRNVDRRGDDADDTPIGVLERNLGADRLSNGVVLHLQFEVKERDRVSGFDHLLIQLRHCGRVLDAHQFRCFALDLLLVKAQVFLMITIGHHVTALGVLHVDQGRHGIDHGLEFGAAVGQGFFGPFAFGNVRVHGDDVPIGPVAEAHVDDPAV